MTKFVFSGPVRVALIFLAVIMWLAAVSWSQTAAQGSLSRPNPPPSVPGAPPSRRPPPEVGGGGGGGGGGGHHHGEGGSFNPCMTVYGVVINWGYRNEPKLPVVLGGPGWQTQKVSDDNGHYASDCLGEGIALLNPASPPWLRPMTADVAIRLGYRQAFEVNLGLYGGELAPTPEVVPTIAANSTGLQAGAIVTYTIQATNTLSDRSTMGGVMITDLLPDALIPVSATSTLGPVELWGNLLTADIGNLSPGQQVTVTITARVRDNIPQAEIANRASLLYSGHVAVQTPILKIGSGITAPVSAPAE